MPEFTRMYRLSNARELGMTEQEYVLHQKELFFNDLLARISSGDKTKLLDA